VKHPLKFVQERGLLTDALGIPREEAGRIEALVEHAIAEHHSMRQLFEAVGELDMSDELWANFLYTYGWWDGRRRA